MKNGLFHRYSRTLSFLFAVLVIHHKFDRNIVCARCFLFLFCLCIKRRENIAIVCCRRTHFVWPPWVAHYRWTLVSLHAKRAVKKNRKSWITASNFTSHSFIIVIILHFAQVSLLISLYTHDCGFIQIIFRTDTLFYRSFLSFIIAHTHTVEYKQK